MKKLLFKLFRISFESRSNKILGVFSKTQAKLQALNQETQAENNAIQQKINQLQSEYQTNSQLIAANNKVSANLDTFLKS